MGAPVTHFEIISRNGERLQEFYSRLFDWKIDASNPMKYGMVKKEGNGIGGGISNPGPDGMTHVTIYAEVADPQVTLDMAVGMGGSVVMPVTEIPGMVTYALFTDPDGNRVGIVKAMPAPKAPRKKRATAKKRSAAKKRGKAKTKRRR